ncbi:hypothetical protein [Nocardia heshunensis]
MRLFRRRKDKRRSSGDIAAEAAAETVVELLVRGLVGVVKTIAHALT